MTALLVWWWAHADGTFVLLGVAEPMASRLGPLLPALSAGLTAAMTLSLVDAAAGTVAGILAAVIIVALPGFLPLHRSSLLGPPFTALTVLMVGVMLHAPRFSIAYGTLAATAAVFVSPAAAGLVIAALAWAALVPGDRERRAERLLLAVVPLIAAIIASHWLGGAWSPPLHLGWHGSLDTGIRAAGRVLGDQLAPGITQPALRWIAIADLTVVLIGIIAVAWRRSQSAAAAPTAARRLLPALLVTGAGVAVGQMAGWLLIPAWPVPALTEAFVLALLAAVAAVAATALLWSRWPWPARLLTGVIALGWLQAAIRF